LKYAVEAAPEIALEAAFEFACGYAFCEAAGGVGLGGWVVLESSEHDGVQGAVELAVAAAAEPVSGGLA